MKAANNGHLLCVDLLINKGAKPYKTDIVSNYIVK
jgi:hypothetical protein